MTAFFASTEALRKVTGETIVPSRIRSVVAAIAASVAQASSEPAGGAAQDREVVVGAEEALEADALGRAAERPPLLPGDSLLPFDHQGDAHGRSVAHTGANFAGGSAS